MTCYPLGKEVWVKPTYLGAKLYSPIDADGLTPEREDPWVGSVILDDAEMVALIGWWAEQRGQDQDEDDLINRTVDLVWDHELDRRTAVLVLRALACCEVAQALAGWVMLDEDADEGEGLT